MYNGINVDLNALARERLTGLPIPQVIALLEQDLKLWNETQVFGRKIVARLEPCYLHRLLRRSLD
jgi:hypothetical protein